MGEFGGQIPVEPPRDGRDSLGVGNSNDKLTVARIRLLGIIGVCSGWGQNDTLRVVPVSFHYVEHGVFADTKIAGNPPI